MRTLILAPTLALLTLAVATPATAGKSTATAAVRTANETISKHLAKKAKVGSAAEQKNAALATEKVRGFLDIDELGKRALVDHWDKLTPAQRTEYLTLLRTLVERNYIKGLRANLNYKVVYKTETVKGDRVIVATEVKTKRRGRPFTIEVDYVLRKDGSTWRAFDVVTDGVGLVENYRAQFNRLIDKRGFDGLLELMKKKLASLEK